MTGRTIRTFVRVGLGMMMIGGVLAQASAAQAAATLVVNTFTDEYTTGATTCSLREAITAASANNDFDACDQTGTYGDDTILLPPGTYTLSLTGSEDTGTNDLDIIGSGGNLTIQSQGGTAQDTIVQAGTIGVVNGVAGNGIDRVFHIQSAGADVTFRDLTIRNGNDAAGDGGGAINHDGSTLTLERVAVRDSSTGAGNGGGGIWASGTLNLDQVEISGNEALGESSGGGVLVFGGSVFGGGVTVSGNRAENDAGGMFFRETGSFNALAGFTIANNVADSDGDDAGDAGGVLQCCNAQVYFTGSILADNAGQTQLDCEGDFNPTAFGANIVENPSGSCTGFDAGDVGLDPQLQALALNAPGSTRTQAIPSTSPAVDRWPTAGCQDSTSKFGAQLFDQRGVSRPQGPACDSGAFELVLASPNVPGVCKGKTATITGTQDNDSLTGTGGNDIIAALGGNDTVKGLGKNDLVCGGDGNDRLKGGGGRDKLLGENGNDNLKGGGGDKDKTVGGKGKDKCSGGSGEGDKAKKCETVKAVP